jgi:ribosome-binding factor A
MKNTPKRPFPTRRRPDVCGELGPGDGVDPRDEGRERRSSDRGNRKTLQLCHQVAETLGLVLAGECSDQTLQNLRILAVRPAPDATQLAVLVCRDGSEASEDAGSILQRLERVAGRLRTEVAASISRKRVPRLLFYVVPAADDVSP